MRNFKKTKNLRSIAKEIRKSVVKMIHSAKSGHPGGSLSCVEILTVLYFDILNIDPKKPKWIDRDRFVLSKGHACPTYYSALALRDFFPIRELMGLRKTHHFLEGHPDIHIPGVDAPSGSLGMGLSQGLGMALGAQYTKRKFTTYVLLGDGDMQSGNTWEAIMAAGHHRLGNLVAILDSNRLQGEDSVEKQMNYFPIIGKFKLFGWDAWEINGHNIEDIKTALLKMHGRRQKPLFILAHTTKGKGILFMENEQYWHGSVTITDEELKKALQELSV